MNIRDLASLDRMPASLDELIDVCKPGGSVSKKCPALAADVTRKAMALKGSVARLRPALDEAGPPPVLKERPPLYLRQSDPVIQTIAGCLGHYGVLEDELYVVTKDLAVTYGNDRVSDAITELVWIHRETRWAKLRPETIRSLRPFIGPVPGDPDEEFWWRDRGGVPVPRAPGDKKLEPMEEPTPAKKRTRAKKG